MRTIQENILTGFLLAIILVSAGCVTNSRDNTNISVPLPGKPFVEVIHFHGNHQCYSCKTVGAYAEETVNTYFSGEVDSGEVIFMHVNFDLPENRELAERYGVTGSSLWIGVYDENGFSAEQDVNVWYKISDKEDYMTYLRGVIKDKLSGDDV